MSGLIIYLRLCYEFFLTGLLSIGGGLATLPFLRDMAERTGWFTIEQLVDMVAVSESTPGPIGINMATYVGYNTAGVIGAAVATLSIAAPSVIIIAIVSKLLARFRENAIVKNVMYGLRPASLALIASAGLEMARLSLLRTAPELDFLSRVDWKSVILAAFLLPIMRFRKVDPIIMIAICAVIGILFKF
ncbi:MAG: chromate transporter [Oscillospiraceae bacterium]|jgi:chromate transporter|nr:chromate transporter [Oscillospiraceae bacterium]